MLRFCALAIVVTIAHADIQGGLTSDFQTWLGKNGYNDWVDKFVRSDLGAKGSFGGKLNSSDKITNQPIIFIHGNSDQALSSGLSPYQTGWTASTNYFLTNGYKNAELYATTWGPANEEMASQQVHSCEYLTQLRKFVEAVIAYTKAKKIDIISHSMGVTLARKVIKGGSVVGDSCDLGPALTAKVDTFLGICGANRGLTTCEYESTTAPTCNKNNGFYPGRCPQLYCTHDSDIKELSAYMVDINQGPKYEGQYVYTFWSHVDELIGFGDIVWGEPTSRIEWQDGEKTSYTNLHMQMKDNTADWQKNAVANHSVA